ncbi:zinc finger protein [Trypanosoma melophagium]|uniref:zinc finger protein n=1 Tax=Trypanosoma melophagium TaxID=715481 RepID=UPI00351A0793|nr:zinc finger protein [Trypanosoma melophagium]
MDSSVAAIDFETFLSALFPVHNNLFTTEVAIRALADYTGLSQWEASQVVEEQHSHHTIDQMQMYVRRLVEVYQGLTEEQHRMTVMLPANHEALSPSEKKHIWGNDDCPSPAPIEPNVESNKKICKQFRQNGTCNFGSRCLYHHSKPLQERKYDTPSLKTLPPSSLGIMNRCAEELEQLKVSDESQERNSRFESREIFGALPSSMNNYCASTKKTKTPLKGAAVGMTSTTTTMPMTMIKTFQQKQKQRASSALLLPQQQQEQLEQHQKVPEGITYQAFAPVGNVVMVPLSLPNGDIYGYAPFPLHLTPTPVVPQ